MAGAFIELPAADARLERKLGHAQVIAGAEVRGPHALFPRLLVQDEFAVLHADTPGFYDDGNDMPSIRLVRL